MVTIYLFINRVGNKNIMQKTYLVILFDGNPCQVVGGFRITVLENKNVKFLSYASLSTYMDTFRTDKLGASPIAIHMPVTFLLSHTLLANWCQGVHTQFENYSHCIIIQVVT